VDFAKTRRLCRLQYAKVAQPLRKLSELRKMDHRLVAVRRKNKMANVFNLRHCLYDLGISQTPQCDMPRDFARYAKVGEVDAKSWQNLPDLENLFLHRWMRYCTDHSFEMANF
jgi:hypothetical protein